MVLSNGHTCDGGNRTLRWSQFCDGVIDCSDRFDEEGHFCKPCINNLYSCAPKDDIRCDLACQILHYVPCQTIQDRRACNHIHNYYDNHALVQLLQEFKFYIVAAIIVILLVLTGLIIFTKYAIRQRRIKSSIKSSNLSDGFACPVECETLSSHIYEQCYEPPLYETAQRYPSMKTYYEHVV